MDLSDYDVIIVGCGLSGIVTAEGFVSVMNKRVLVIDTRDCLYIGNTDSSQDVKKLVNKMKVDENNIIKDMLNVHAKAYRPWGWYINLEGKN